MASGAQAINFSLRVIQIGVTGGTLLAGQEPHDAWDEHARVGSNAAALIQLVKTYHYVFKELR